MVENKTDKHYFTTKGHNAESIVHNLAYKSFLTDWCYPNLKKEDGKEICDLLIIFDDIAIIWQIKDLKVGQDMQYKRNKVEKNFRQLIGAKRTLFNLKKKVILKNPRRGDEEFDPTVIKHILLISALVGDEQIFFNPYEEFEGHNIHVFNRDFTEIVLSELDTISDFTEYLFKKESFMAKSKSLVISGGEQGLLSYYLTNMRDFGALEQMDSVYIEDGIRDSFIQSQSYKNKKQADKISYGRDSIINRAHEGSIAYEKVARELARPNRFERRSLADAFGNAWRIANKDKTQPAYRRSVIPKNGNTIYCFLFVDKDQDRQTRINMLSTMCYIHRRKYPAIHTVIGIATEKQLEKSCSYDYCLLYMPLRSEEDSKQAEELQKESGVLSNATYSHYIANEFPNTNKDNIDI